MNRSIVLVLSFFLILLVACGNETTDTEPEKEIEGSTEEDDDDDAVDDVDNGVSRTPEMDFDLEGRTIKVVSWWDMTIDEDNPDSIKRKKRI